jgi:hypothetical protein
MIIFSANLLLYKLKQIDRQTKKAGPSRLCFCHSSFKVLKVLACKDKIGQSVDCVELENEFFESKITAYLRTGD